MVCFKTFPLRENVPVRGSAAFFAHVSQTPRYCAQEGALSTYGCITHGKGWLCNIAQLSCMETSPKGIILCIADMSNINLFLVGVPISTVIFEHSIGNF